MIQSSRVYFIASASFPTNTVKVVLSNVPSEDILIAHKDLYETNSARRPDVENDTNDGRFSIEELGVAHNPELFLQSIRQLKGRLFANFFRVDAKPTIVHILNAVNSLHKLTSESIFGSHEKDQLGKCCMFPPNQTGQQGDFHCPLIVGVAEASVDEDASSTAVSPSGCDFIALTRILGISFDVKEDDVAVNWSPSHRPFIVFNRGYGYLLKELRNIFPEFTIVPYEDFPLNGLAEQMLYYQVDNSHYSFYHDLTTERMVENVRVFFGCSKRTPTSATQAMLGSNDVSEFLRNEQGNRSCPGSNDWHCLLDTSCPQPGRPSAEPVPGLNPAECQFAGAFESHPSPCKDAFVINDRKQPWGEKTDGDAIVSLVSPASRMTSQPGEVASLTPFPWRNLTRKGVSEVTLHADRKMIIKAFADNHCIRLSGAKVKSSLLFSEFKEFYDSHHYSIPFEKMYNQTSFTMLLKEFSNFQTKREKDGVYWMELHVERDPSVSPYQFFNQVVPPCTPYPDIPPADPREHAPSAKVEKVLQSEPSSVTLPTETNAVHFDDDGLATNGSLTFDQIFKKRV